MTSREEWLEARRGSIGASEVATILGISPFKSSSVLGLYLEKTGQAPDREESEWMKRGLQLQDTIAEMYEEETGRDTRDLGAFTIQRNPDYPFLHATLDVEVLPNEDHDTPGAGEVKNVGEWMGEHWRDGMPEYVSVQMQTQLLVSGRTWGSVMVLIGGNRFLWCDVEANAIQQETIIRVCRDFWDCVESETPPVAGADDHAALATMHPVEEPGKSVALDGDATGWADQIDSAKILMKAEERCIASSQAMIKQAMGDAETGVMPSGRTVTWKANKKGVRVFLLRKAE